MLSEPIHVNKAYFYDFGHQIVQNALYMSPNTYLLRFSVKCVRIVIECIILFSIFQYMHIF